ncbi:histidine phosphatase superfamily [Apiospora aurea]|uniref:Histidine phosphatase superfamily n=1 Tax=Apiospora aurea TaxID=335848 RepID=A0ABR1Q9M4_9PEZI
MLNPASSLLLSAAAASAASVNLDWHAPAVSAVNNLTSALQATGTYGFIFNTSRMPDAQYGTYNWCNMPHDEYELRYVEVIQRHHKRTPYAANAFPVEPYRWDCDDQGLYYFGQSLGADTDTAKKSAQTYWKGTNSTINPFVPAGWIGSCQFPQITSGGLDDSRTHGEDLYDVYHSLLGFLPSRDEEDGEAWRRHVVYRVTNNQITSQVASQLIAGMWGASALTRSVPLLIQASGVDSLEPQYPCPSGSTASDRLKTPAIARWQQHLDAARPLFATLDAISGVPPTDPGFHASFDHYYDNLSARQCHGDAGKPLPCNTTTGQCVTQDLADAVYRLGQWEYSHLYRDAGPAALRSSAAAYGVWIAELAAHLRAVTADAMGDVRYLHNVAHDGSLSRVLAVLQIDVMVWPGMGSEVVFEVYRKEEAGDGSEHYVRVLFGGRPLKSSNPSLGLMDMLPLETLLAYFDGLVGQNASLIKGKCNGSIPL